MAIQEHGQQSWVKLDYIPVYKYLPLYHQSQQKFLQVFIYAEVLQLCNRSTNRLHNLKIFEHFPVRICFQDSAIYLLLLPLITSVTIQQDTNPNEVLKYLVILFKQDLQAEFLHLFRLNCNTTKISTQDTQFQALKAFHFFCALKLSNVLANLVLITKKYRT